jgi:hypothetical protein
VRSFLATASPQQVAQFQQTGALPEPYASQVLAHGVSAAFRLAAVLAVAALVVILIGIRPKRSSAGRADEAAPEEVAAGTSARS